MVSLAAVTGVVTNVDPAAGGLDGRVAVAEPEVASVTPWTPLDVIAPILALQPAPLLLSPPVGADATLTDHDGGSGTVRSPIAAGVVGKAATDRGPRPQPVAAPAADRESSRRHFDGSVDPAVFSAYLSAASQWETMGCTGRWSILAAIGHVESRHGRAAGPHASITEEGRIVPEILGPALDGTRYALIRDTDGGALDGDTEFDRAVGPMQFIPSTWVRYQRDGNGDGVSDPHNIYDATLSAAAYLCAVQPGDFGDEATLAAAVFGYNRDAVYVRQVLDLIGWYDTGQVSVRGVLPERPPLESEPVGGFEPDGEDVVDDQLDVPVAATVIPPSPTDQAPTDQPATDQAPTDQPATDQAATDQAATEQAPTEEAPTDQMVTEQAATEQPATDQPATEQPATEQAPTDQPATEQAPTDQPTASPTDQPSPPCVATTAPPSEPTTTTSDAPPLAEVTSEAPPEPCSAGEIPPVCTIPTGARTTPTTTSTAVPVIGVIEATVQDLVTLETDDPTLPCGEVVISITSPSEVDVEFEWELVFLVDSDRSATPGSDYVELRGTAVIPAGRSSTTVPVFVMSDDLREDEEQFLVEIRALTPGIEFTDGKSTATVSIIDDDQEPGPGDAPSPTPPDSVAVP